MSALPDARLALRPRGVLEGADLALAFLAVHSATFARAALVVAAPGFGISLALRYALGWDWVAVWALSLGLAAVAEGPFTVLAGRLALQDAVRARDVAGTFARRGAMLGVALAGAWVFQAVALSVLVAPWAVAAGITVFLPEVVLLEGANRGAFRRAVHVVAGSLGRAVGLSVLLAVLRGAAVALTDATLRRAVGLALDVHATTESLWSDGGSPYALAGLWLSVPVCAVVRYVAYIDLRTLREGWDVQRRLQGLAAALAATERA